MKSQLSRQKLSEVFASFTRGRGVSYRRVFMHSAGVALFLVGVVALLCGYVEGAGVLAMATLTKDDLDTIIEFCHTTAEEALENGSREQLRSALETISDVCHEDSILEVDNENGTVEVTGWDEGQDGDDTDADEE